MTEPSSLPPSFSAGRRWAIFFSVIISILTAVVLVVLVNYAGTRYYRRFNWNNENQTVLSAQTIALLKSITNDVKVVVYYDKSDNLYSLVSALANEYHQTNPHIVVETVDYLVDAAKAVQVKTLYKLGNSADKNLVIFDGNGKHKILPAALLGDYKWETVASDKEPTYNKHLESFEGEIWFSAALLNITKPTLTAYYLQGNREHRLEGENPDDYEKFKLVLNENNVAVVPFTLLGSNAIPAECKLLIIAGPRELIPPDELDKISHFLTEGGRLLVLFNSYTRNFSTGLEGVLAAWNVKVGMNVISDPENTESTSGAIIISSFKTNHLLIDPLLGSGLAMVRPRSISALKPEKPSPESPKIDELAFTGKNSAINDAAVGRNVPVLLTVEKGSLKGVLRGSTAILAIGDSSIFCNGNSAMGIDVMGNRDFASFAIDWLFDQTELLKGVGPHPVKEYRFAMTRGQLTSLRWIFLAAIPGGILLFGMLVWFRRRY